MDKKKAISIITKSAKLYHENLEDQKLLFIYGVPAVINKQLFQKVNVISGLDYYEVVFHRSNFLHLTGVILNRQTTRSAINFYEKCIDGRLSENDFMLSRDGTTDQKLDVILKMMNIKKTAAMIGDFTDRGPKLYSEKVAGNICACMGFVADSYTKQNVPNTLLKKDVRDVSVKPQQKVFAIMSKNYSDDKYTVIEKCDKSIELRRVEGIHNYADI
ncbi:PBECR4 domain-containing protein [Butyrivibrio sp. MC2013]|uniref:PBECR4 domain-containing protein n=1 Tax=Butyrivibrio sp. MC2013 TaxID=1280686 RepID=UPI000409E7E6|nr:PBECR4 domain-containing protein [Butyrivibrio sp. MC2013]